MAEINLLETQGRLNAVKEQGKRWLLRIATLIFVVALGVYGYLFFSDRSSQKQIRENRAVILQAQSDLENNRQRSELITRQGQLKSANKLLGEHLFWSGLLPELARVTLTSAQYSSIETGTEGDMFVTVTVPTYTDAEKFLQVFDLPEYNQQFSNVRVLALSQTQKDNVLQTSMRLQLILNPNLLRRQIQ
ncbi:MAG TPA: hypothetical protein PKD79_01315 [Candidatus Doudnabacteria bacterium]|nr:hypothetical protein [Candidatus Doudnabacteria bacterium]